MVAAQAAEANGSVGAFIVRLSGSMTPDKAPVINANLKAKGKGDAKRRDSCGLDLARRPKQHAT